MNSYYPVFLSLEEQVCIVIGGGEVADRKVRSLLASRAHVRVIAPQLTSGLQELLAAGSISWLQRSYRLGDLAGAFLVIAATDDVSANAEIKAEADREGLLVNVVDDAELCNFILPSVIRRGDLIVAFSTGGKSPALAKRLREQLEKEIGPEYGQLLELLGGLRDEVKARFRRQAERAAFWERLVNSDILDLLRQGETDLVKERIDEAFRQEEV